MNGKRPTPRAQKSTKSPTLSWGGPSGIHLILPLLSRMPALYDLYNFQKVIRMQTCTPTGWFCLFHYASIKSKREHPPWANPRGIFLRWSKALPRGKIFLQKHGPRGKKTPTPGEYFRRSSQPFLLTGVEILGFFRNQRLKRIERLSYYSLVIPSSFSLSTILEVLKFSPALKQIL